MEMVCAGAGFEFIGPPLKSPRERKPRKPSIATLVARAERTGKRVTSITTPDGTTINFGEPVSAESNNPWLADLPKVKQ
jgi:hypothetical protein